MKNKKCIVEGCESTGIEGRGCCLSHYWRHMRAVKSGLATWKMLEKAKLSLPLKREVYSMYDEAMKKAKAKRELV